MKIILTLIIFFFLMHYITGFLLCPKKSSPPQKIDIDTSYTINPVIYKGVNFTTFQIGSKIFLNYLNFVNKGTTQFYDNSDFCPENFKIPVKEDYELLIKELGDNAFSNLTDPKGFNMQPNYYYLTNTKGKVRYNKIFMYLDGKKIKYIDSDPFEIRAVCKCMLDLYSIKFSFPNNKGDLNLNEKTLIRIENNNLNGYLWKIGENLYTTKSVEYSFKTSGRNNIEFWGNLINGELIYYCDYAFVKKKSISSSQKYDDSKIKLISTDFKMKYFSKIHFQHSNSPVAPRIDGGYYISFTDSNNFLHILSYDKGDNLIKDFNTTEKAYPHDITATDYGFAIYMSEVINSNHSYINLYNKNFELVNTVQIMNNSLNDNINKDSNLKKQIIRYNSTGYPVFGMRYMYRPDNGKLAYSRGRIFLIFSHYNFFDDGRGGHTGDTVVTFNDGLQDMDFGLTWGASHSLIQSVTFDDYYFWSAALSDAYPMGIKVEYTSKREINKDVGNYDSINQKYNLRVYSENNTLAGRIKGYSNGRADGKLGGILYFENLNIYCLIYAKTPNESSDEKDGKNIIYITTWNFENEKITNINTKEVKIFTRGNVMQVRAGKYGEDKVFIIYSETMSEGGNDYGNIIMGTIPNLYIIDISTLNTIKSDVKMDNLIMNTNEDLKTFNDGVLIWASANKEGKLVINKIGTPLLNEQYDDINYIMTKDDLVKENEEEDNGKNNGDNGDNNSNNNKSSSSLSLAAKLAITFGIIIFVSLLIFGIFILIRHLHFKKLSEDINSLKINKLMG